MNSFATKATTSIAHPCAHALVSRSRNTQCPHRYSNGYDPCRPPRLDHAELWNVPGGRLLTYQPYGRPDPAKVTAFDAQWGTVTTVRGPEHSWWNPGHTFLVTVAPASDVDEPDALRLVCESPDRRTPPPRRRA